MMEAPRVSIEQTLTAVFNSNRQATQFVLKPEDKETVWNMPVGALEEMKSRVEPGTTIVFHSGGLESSMAALSYVGQSNGNVVHLHVPDVKSAYPGELIEPHLLQIAQQLKGKAAVIGLEYGPESESIGRTEGFKVSVLHARAKDLGIALVLPVILMEKFDLFRMAERTGIFYCSCDDAKIKGQWCGKCFKCFQITTFFKCLGTPMHQRRVTADRTTFRPEDLTRWIREIQRYFSTGIDPFMTDMHSFKAALMYALGEELPAGRWSKPEQIMRYGNALEQIWDTLP